MIIIIGGTGFIGLYTVEQFVKEGYDVVATGRKDIYKPLVEKMGAKYIHLDVTNKEDFKKLPTQNVEGVIHLAGLLPANAKVNLDEDENAGDYVEVNIQGTVNVLEYCRKNNIKKIINNTSYADIFDSWQKGVAIADNTPRGFSFTGDHAVYVITRNAATDLVEYYSQQHGLQGATFRFPPVYGVGPHNAIYVNGKYYKTGLQTFIEAAEAGKDIEIWGDPYIERDIIYVKDVAKAYVKAIQSDKARGVYNMTSGTRLTLLDQVKATIEIFGKGKGSKIVFRPEKKNNTPSFLFDISRNKKDFGFEPEYTDYTAIMKDYKKELESGRWQLVIDSRAKD